MSISEAKLEANRANAAFSSGPTSAFGRARSAQNAIKHGLCGKFAVLESENQDEYNELLQRFIDTEKPADDVEYELVAKMARATWMSERAVRFQSGCFLHHRQTAEHVENESQDINVRFPELDRFLRYQSMHDRAYDRAANALAKHRKEKAAQERGFVSQKREEAVDARRVVAETRREKQDKQRDELFAINRSNAKIRRDLNQIRLLKQFPLDMHGQVLQAVA